MIDSRPGRAWLSMNSLSNNSLRKRYLPSQFATATRAHLTEIPLPIISRRLLILPVLLDELRLLLELQCFFFPRALRCRRGRGASFRERCFQVVSGIRLV